MLTALEICVDSFASAIAAEAGGAQRVELCSGLIEGGLTPSLGLIHAVRARLKIGVHVMIRPRGGDFVYSEDELGIMRDDISLAAEAGADGVVFGLLTADGLVDLDQARKLVALARPLQVTFHRAIDTTANLFEALEAVIRAGADRVLTSGGEATALDGQATLQRMVHAAAGRIEIMAGGGVRPDNLEAIARATGATSFHSGMRRAVQAIARQPLRQVRLGAPDVDDSVRHVVSVEDVEALAAAARKAGAPDL